MKGLSNTQKLKAFSLIEIVITIAIASLVILSVASFSIEATRYNENKWERAQAGIKIKEVTSSLQAIKNNAWSTLVNVPSSAPRHIDIVNNRLTIQNGLKIENGVTYGFSLLPVYRDSNLNIVESGGTIDYGTRNAVVEVSWTDRFGTLNNISSNIYLTNWNTQNYSESTTSEFSDGANFSTYVDSAINNGAVRLQSVVYSDWCRPELSSATFDLPGQAVARAISAIPGVITAGTGTNSSGVSLSKLSVSDTYPPNTNLLGTFNGYKTNGLFTDGNFAYITTDDNGKELVIVNISTTPYTEVGFFNPSGSGDGKSVFVQGNYGFLTMSTNNQLYIFDLSSKTGSRPLVRSVTLAGRGTKVVVNGNYAYVSIAGAATEMQIINITNVATASIVGQADVNGEAATDLFVNSAGTRAYLATAVSSSQREFFLVDITTKTGNRPTLSSYETNGMNPMFIASTPDNSNRLIIGGTGGEEYQVVSLSNETNPVRCGGLQYNTGIFNGALIKEADNDVYSYILTGDTGGELVIIRGGEGGGDANGNGFVSSGEYISNVFNATSQNVFYYYTKWNRTTPAGSTLRLQFRASNLSDMSDASWVGPDGTSGTYFTNQGGETFPANLQNKQYLQYRALLTSDRISTPYLEDIIINYGK